MGLGRGQSGYDPCEMLIDPQISSPYLKIAWNLFRKAIGMRFSHGS